MVIEANKIYHCPTVEDAEAFIAECNSQNIFWRGQNSAAEYTNWEKYKEKTCYLIDTGTINRLAITYAYLEYFKNEHPDKEIITYHPISSEYLEKMDAEWKKLMQIT